LWQLLGFYGDDYEDEEDEFEEEPAPKQVPPRKGVQKKAPFPRLIYFRGIPSETARFELRDALLEGAMLMLDLHGLDASRLEEGNDFLNFMRGVAFAHKGETERLGSSLFLVMPHAGMFRRWTEEGGSSDAGSFDRQGR
jgi:hypothetical protein